VAVIDSWVCGDTWHEAAPQVDTVVVPLPAGDGAVATVTVAGAFTVSTKASDAVAEPSLTVRVMVAVPVMLVGVTVTVRLPPAPPKTMFVTGTSAVLDDARVSVSEPVPFCPPPG